MAIAIEGGIPFQADATTASGCVGVKKAGKALVACGKVTAPGSARCPRCEVLAADGSPEHPEGMVPVREAIACLAENHVALEDRVKLLEGRIGAADSNFKLIADRLHTATVTARALLPHKPARKDVN